MEGMEEKAVLTSLSFKVCPSPQLCFFLFLNSNHCCHCNHFCYYNFQGPVQNESVEPVF